MASQLTPHTLGAPGFYGLNTQDSPIELDQKFALEATNVVIDKWGRLGSRKGHVRQHAANADLSTNPITLINEVVQNNGTITVVAAGNGMLFKHVAPIVSPVTAGTLTRLTYGGGGVAPTIDPNNWQFCQLNGIGLFFQRGHDPLVFDPATLGTASTTTFRRLSETTGYAGTVPLANCALSAYGRIWCADTTTDKNTVAFSDVTTPQVWTGGTSGTLNLLGVWPRGGDEIVALAAHNNFLIIFGKRQILLYQNADNPSIMSLADSIEGVGCIARDSVQNTGEDVIFLSNSGVRSLQRTIQEKSSPMRTLSKNVQDDIQYYIGSELTSDIKSVYSPVDYFYLISFPTTESAYCFDLRFPLEDGSNRTTYWSTFKAKCYFYSISRKLYMGHNGYVTLYNGYKDHESTYRMYYYTTWQDFGAPVQISILKKIIATVVGATSQVLTFKWGFDFIGAQFIRQSTVQSIAPLAEYGTSEYGIGEYQGGSGVSLAAVQGAGSGKVLQVGFEAEVNGNLLSMQKLEIFTKEAKLGS